MYEGPITLVTDNIAVHIDEEILKGVQNIGINIDRAELIRALAYDRDQYKKGYADRDDEYGHGRKTVFIRRTTLHGLPWMRPLLPTTDRFDMS